MLDPPFLNRDMAARDPSLSVSLDSQSLELPVRALHDRMSSYNYLYFCIVVGWFKDISLLQK